MVESRSGGNTLNHLFKTKDIQIDICNAGPSILKHEVAKVNKQRKNGVSIWTVFSWSSLQYEIKIPLPQLSLFLTDCTKHPNLLPNKNTTKTSSDYGTMNSLTY